MRKGWEYKKLGEVCDVINGLWIGKKEPFINVAVIRNTNFSKDCQLNLDKVAFIDVEVKQFASKKLKFGDIIIEKSGGSDKQPVGRPILFNISDGNYSFSNFTSTLRIKDNTEVNSAYLHKCLYAFYLKGETIKLQSKTTGLHNLNIKGYLRLNIPLPPLSTQLAIVSELDKINELIRLKKEQLKDFDNLAQSLFYEMFGDPVENEKGWEVKKIKDIAKYYNGVAHEQDVDKDGDFVLINAKFISSEGQIKKYSSIQRFPLLKNDIVMVLSDLPNGKSLAKCFLIDEDNKYTLNQRICCFRGFEGSSVYLKNIINRNPYLLSFDNGKGQTNLRKGDVEKLPIPLPPLSLQRLFALRIEQIEREKSEVQKSIQDLETLLASRMQYWFE